MNTPFSLLDIKTKYFVLKNNLNLEGHTTKRELVEVIRILAEIVVYGQEGEIFEYFIEHDFLDMLHVLYIYRNTPEFIRIQILQTITIVFKNLKHNAAKIALLSNEEDILNFIYLSVSPSNEDIFDQFISFLRVLSGYLSQPKFVPYFVKLDTQGNVTDFPFLNRVLLLLSQVQKTITDVMVTNSIRLMLMAVFCMNLNAIEVFIIENNSLFEILRTLLLTSDTTVLEDNIEFFSESLAVLKDGSILKFKLINFYRILLHSQRDNEPFLAFSIKYFNDIPSIAVELSQTIRECENLSEFLIFSKIALTAMKNMKMSTSKESSEILKRFMTECFHFRDNADEISREIFTIADGSNLFRDFDFSTQSKALRHAIQEILEMPYITSLLLERYSVFFQLHDFLPHPVEKHSFQMESLRSLDLALEEFFKIGVIKIGRRSYQIRIEFMTSSITFRIDDLSMEFSIPYSQFVPMPVEEMTSESTVYAFGSTLEISIFESKLESVNGCMVKVYWKKIDILTTVSVRQVIDTAIKVQQRLGDHLREII